MKIEPQTDHRWFRVTLPDGRFIFVVRHDLVDGGTKALVLPSILDNLANSGKTKFSYATPSWGYAQYALAATCKKMGHEAHIFVPARKERSLPTTLASDAGAIVHEVRVGYLAVVQKRESEWLQENPDAVGIPFGVDIPEMSNGLSSLASWMEPQPPKDSRVWVAAGSGTLWRSLSKAWKDNPFGVVQVGKDIDWSGLRSNDMKFKAPEKFERPAKKPPPFPSALNYDAKVWQFILAHAADGDVFWNVAG